MAFSNSNSHVPNFHIVHMSGRSADFLFFFSFRSEVNNGCFSGLQSAGGGENGLLGGIKYQGERLGLIRDFLSEKMFLPVATAGLNSNQWKWKRCPCVATGSEGQPHVIYGLLGWRLWSAHVVLSFSKSLPFICALCCSFPLCVFDLMYPLTRKAKLQESVGFPGNNHFTHHHDTSDHLSFCNSMTEGEIKWSQDSVIVV